MTLCQAKARSCSGGWREHNVGEGCAGRDWYMRRAGAGQSHVEGKETFQGAAWTSNLPGFVSMKCDLSLLGATGVKTSHLGWGWRGSGGQSLGLGTLPGPLIQ